MTRIRLLVIALLLPPVSALGIGPDVPPDGWPTVTVGAPTAVLVDLDTGQVLAARDADLRVPPASTIKLLTALSVLSRSDLDERVTAGPEVTGQSGATVGLRVGDVWTVEELLAGLVAQSGNDAAAALAAHVGGGEEGLLELMRADAHALGIEGATIRTTSGLGDLDRLSARDLATITQRLYDDPRFGEIAARREVDLPGLGRVASRNTFLDVYPGARGVKTGQTRAAGRCLVAVAERDDRRLLAVVLGGAEPDGHVRDVVTLLDHGFGAFIPIGAALPSLRVRVGGAWLPYDTPVPPILVPRDGPVTVEMRAPVEAGGPGQVAVRWRSEDLAVLDLVAGEAVDARSTTVATWLADRAYASMRAVLAGSGGG